MKLDVPFGLQRVPREQPWKAEVGCSLVAALILTAVGGLTAYMEHLHPSTGRNPWVALVVGWSFLCLGLLMLVAVVYNALATMNPETIIAVDKNPIARGETLTIHLQQPGPVRLKSLRADFSGEELFVPMPGTPAGETRTVVDRRHLGTFKFFSRDDLTVRRAESFAATATLVIPIDIQPSSRIDHTTTTWRIEVWGSVRNGFNFRHPFVIRVT